MSELIRVPGYTDERGTLSVVDGLLPFPIRRVFYIHDVPSGMERAGHGHVLTRHALVCVSGSCEVVVGKGEGARIWLLDDPRSMLLLEPEEWHLIRRFALGTVLVCFASETYDPADCRKEPLP